MEKRISERSAGLTAFEAETCENKGGLLDRGNDKCRRIDLPFRSSGHPAESRNRNLPPQRHPPPIWGCRGQRLNAPGPEGTCGGRRQALIAQLLTF
jgi:hypothetical protein